MRHRLKVMFAIAISAVSVFGCMSENERYAKAVAPLVTEMQSLAAAVTETAASLKAGEQIPDQKTFDRLDSALSAIRSAYAPISPPPDMTTRNGYILQSLASEATAISALRTLAGRYGDMAEMKSTAAEPKALKDIEDQIKGGWTFFNDNHRYFTEYLATYTAAMGRKK